MFSSVDSACFFFLRFPFFFLALLELDLVRDGVKLNLVSDFPDIGSSGVL